jgi:hypothetical protein
MPGRHADQTSPPGGDFVVMVTDPGKGWKKHQFTHGDIFMDLEAKRLADPDSTDFMLTQYANIVVNGDDPDKIAVGENTLSGVHPNLFFYAVQCLAVAEHRRFARYEAKFGGRFLPLRFSAGIVEGLWTAGQAIEKQKRGRPGVEWLEKDYGTPFLTQVLMN